MRFAAFVFFVAKKVTITAVVAIIVVAIMAVTLIRPKRTTARQPPCVQNLKEIESAKWQWQIENHKTTNDTPNWDELKYYCGWDTNGVILTCPSGGTYMLGRADEPPRCSLGDQKSDDRWNHRLP